MTASQYFTCVTELENYTDPDAYVSGLALSEIWGDDPAAEISPDRIAAIREIWTAAHRSVRLIAALADTTMTGLSRRFGIPPRTVTSWSIGERTPPVYITLMMQEALGIYHPHLTEK